MERVLLNNTGLIKANVPDTQYFVMENLAKIDVPDNCNVDILINYINSKELTINIGHGVFANIAFLAKDSFDELEIKINVAENSHVEGFFADFTKGKERLAFVSNLLERNSIMNWHLASLTAGSDNKTFDISVNHIAPNTYAKMDNYGVCKDDGKLVFSGISTINNGSKGSKTHQNSKIMVFDHLSNGIAKPILKIDENDIEASHAAVVGKINDEHLFYLTSRGLTESAAKELITYGYLKPIMNGFIDEKIKEEISSLIEGRM